MKFNLSSFTLHIIAMVLMLGDHLWATLLPAQEWLTCLGRIAFPIFAFMTVEGYFHTHNLKKYLLRLLGFAVISEIPFDLMTEGVLFYPFHQNVLWTFLIGLTGIFLIEKAHSKCNRFIYFLCACMVVLLGFVLGSVGMADYYGPGVLTVFIFYFFRGKKWWQLLGQLIGMYFVNIQLLGGFFYPVNILGYDIEIVQQGFAILALIPIWLYNGRQGYHSKTFQYICYAFYPIHLLAIGLIMKFINR